MLTANAACGPVARIALAVVEPQPEVRVVQESIRWPHLAGIWAGFTVTAPAGEIGIVESLVPPVGDRGPGLVVRGGVAGVRRFHVAAAQVERVDAEAREIRLRTTPDGAESWPWLREAMGISQAEWRRQAQAAMSTGPTRPERTR
jgi:hypothetical protein